MISVLYSPAGVSIRILVADDQTLERRGLCEILRSGFPAGTVAEAASMTEMWRCLETGAYDLLVISMAMPGANYAESLPLLRQKQQRTRVLAVAAVPDLEYGIRMMHAGADGYITKYVGSDELLLAAGKVASGTRYFSNDAPPSNVLRADHEPVPPVEAALSERELEVLRCLARGYSVKQTAHALSLSEKTVSTYIGRIRQKTGLQNYVDMARYALRHGLVE